MVIKRDIYIQKLISRKDNGAIKVITGVRRCGKSYILFNLYYEYLRSLGITEDHVVKIAFDSDEYEELLDYRKLGAYIRSLVKNSEPYYLLLDEIQFVPDFEKVLNGLNRYENLDIYVTGSNSRFLSSDVLSEFRGRGDEVRIYPLSFAEFLPYFDGDKTVAWRDFLTYGGLPRILYFKTDEQKSLYLQNLFTETYLKDIADRHNLRDETVLDTLVKILSSATGSLTNPTKLTNTFKSELKKDVSDKTIKSYIGYLEDSFLISEAQRYDVKGKKYISTTTKFYFTDIGLRNAVLNFRQYEPTHLMENIIYNELKVRGYNVDVGIVDVYGKDGSGKSVKTSVEIDFVCNQGSLRYYVQSAYSLPDSQKIDQEKKPLLNVKDFFKKIIIVNDNIKLWRSDDGIVFMNVLDFLCDKNSLDF
jgi:uncharacterized protein